MGSPGSCIRPSTAAASGARASPTRTAGEEGPGECCVRGPGWCSKSAKWGGSTAKAPGCAMHPPPPAPAPPAPPAAAANALVGVPGSAAAAGAAAPAPSPASAPAPAGCCSVHSTAPASELPTSWHPAAEHLPAPPATATALPNPACCCPPAAVLSPTEGLSGEFAIPAPAAGTWTSGPSAAALVLATLGLLLAVVTSTPPLPDCLLLPPADDTLRRGLPGCSATMAMTGAAGLILPPPALTPPGASLLAAGGAPATGGTAAAAGDAAGAAATAAAPAAGAIPLDRCSARCTLRTIAVRCCG